MEYITLEKKKTFTYVCTKCGKMNTFKEGFVLQCETCNSKIFKKPRTTKIINIQAR